MTEPTDALVLFDAGCVFCARLAALAERSMPAAGFVPLQAPNAAEVLGISDDELLAEMKVITDSGEILGGADAVLYLAAAVWWARPIAWVGRCAAGRRLMGWGYRWVAEHRSCSVFGAGGKRHEDVPHSKGLRPKIISSSLAAAITIGLSAWLSARFLPSWAAMWTIALVIFAWAKVLTLRPSTTPRKAAYLFFWPGMDAPRFLDTTDQPRRPGAREWLEAIQKTLLGITLLWVVTPAATEPLLQGWLGLFGTIFVLHFGTFHLLSLAWRRAGVAAMPIMRAPILAGSLAEFWGERWNRGFADLANSLVFRPLARRTGVRAAMLAVFVVSGVLHELVISVPAGAGYGLPLGYFVLQGLGVAFEPRGWRGTVAGRLLTLLVTAGPLFWLFHPPFIRRVALPFLEIIHAL